MPALFYLPPMLLLGPAIAALLVYAVLRWVIWAPGAHVEGLKVMLASLSAGCTETAAFFAAVRAAAGLFPIAMTRTPSRAALEREL